MRYLELADQLREEITAGAFGAGGELPSESALGARVGVSRVTVRRALEVLRDEGLVRSRQGSGWFVAVDPLRQTLGRFTTVEAALAHAGVEPVRRVLQFHFAAAPPAVAATLGLGPDREVLTVRRINLADGDPFALVTVWIPATLGAEWSRAEVERHTFFDLLTALGVELGAVTQTITAELATDDDAEHLAVTVGSPLLVCSRVTRDPRGVAVMVSEQRYPGHRMALDVEFPVAHPGATGVPGLHPVPTAGAASPFPADLERAGRSLRGARHG